MDLQKIEHDNVVNHIANNNKHAYEVLSNVDKEEHYISSVFPDLILLNKETKKPVIIIEVKRNGGIANCMQAWKNVPNLPATLWFIVPELELPNAKQIAQVIGLKARFGKYTLKDGNVNVVYE